MRLDRGLAEIERGRRSPQFDMPRDISRSTSSSRSVSRSRPGTGSGVGRLATSSISSRVTCGASSASPTSHDLDRHHELFGGGVLQQEAAGACPERGIDVVLEVERREHQHVRRVVGGIRPDLRGRPRSRPCAASGRPSARRRAGLGAPARAPRDRRRPLRPPSATAPPRGSCATPDGPSLGRRPGRRGSRCQPGRHGRRRRRRCRRRRWHREPGADPPAATRTGSRA